jgi:hypothetical protein
MDGSNNVIDFVKAKERKEAMEWIEKMFEELDQQEEWNRLLTGKDLYDYNGDNTDGKS